MLARAKISLSAKNLLSLKVIPVLGLPLLSGFLIGTSYIPFPPLAVFFCYVPLWLFALKQKKLKNLIIGAWFCQFVVTLIGFNWLVFAIQEMGFPFWPHTFFLFLFFASIANLHIPLSLFLYFISRALIPAPARSLHILLLPIYLALCQEYYPMIFKWHLGYTLFYVNLPISQTAEIWGFKFLNTLILLFNLVFLYVFIELFRKKKNKVLKKAKGFSFDISSRIPILKKRNKVLKNFTHKIRELRIKTKQFITLKNKVFLSLLFFSLAFGALNVYGIYLKNRLPLPKQKIRVLIVQPNISNEMQEDEKWNDHIMSKILRETCKHLSNVCSAEFQSKKASFTEDKRGILSESQGITAVGESIPRTTQKIDFILWPEGAYPYSIDLSKVKEEKDPIQQLSPTFNLPLIVTAKGINTLKAEHKNNILNDYSGSSIDSPSSKLKENIIYTNSVFVFQADGKLLEGPYNKTILLPFGEYTPGANWFPFIDKWLFGGESRAYSPGKGTNQLIKLNKWGLGFQICYEALFDGLSRDLVKKGADILINVSNDAWFGSLQEPYQHLYMTLSRAIEVRRPLIRGTNSGFSAIISAKGDILFKPKILNKNLSEVQEVPVYSQDKKPFSLFSSYAYYINEVFLWTSFILVHFFCCFSRKHCIKL